MKIPKLLETLFDQFPLQTYPKESRDFQKSLEKFYFRSLLPSSPSVHFILAVHNIREVQLTLTESKYLATDPAGLADALVLCYRNKLTMPKPFVLSSNDSSETGQSVHSMVPLSYLASPDNELPMLIEVAGDTTKYITKCSNITSSIATKSFSKGAIDSTVNFFLDQLQTLWVYTILHEISFSGAEVLLNVFYSREKARLLETCNSRSEPSPNLLESLKLIEDMQSWGSFKDRYGYLYNSSNETLGALLNMWKHVVSGSHHTVASDAFKTAYATEIAKFFKTLPLAVEHIRSKEDSETKSILEIKLAAFILCCVYFLPNNSILRTILNRDHKDSIYWTVDAVRKY